MILSFQKLSRVLFKCRQIHIFPLSLLLPLIEVPFVIVNVKVKESAFAMWLFLLHKSLVGLQPVFIDPNPVPLNIIPPFLADPPVLVNRLAKLGKVKVCELIPRSLKIIAKLLVLLIDLVCCLFLDGFLQFSPLAFSIVPSLLARARSLRSCLPWLTALFLGALTTHKF